MESMPDATRSAFNAIVDVGLPMPDKTWLCGGTGLSMHWNHRQSEDLDFLVESELDKGQIKSWALKMIDAGHTVKDAMPLGARHDAINDGIDLDSYQQDFIINGEVKVTFFHDMDNTSILKTAECEEVGMFGDIRVPDSNTLFRLKIKALLDRHKSRDSFDIATAIKNHGYSIDFVIEEIEHMNPHAFIDTYFQRLTASTYPDSDEGFSELANDNSPFKSIDELSSFMKNEVSEWVSRKTAIMISQKNDLDMGI